MKQFWHVLLRLEMALWPELMKIGQLVGPLVALKIRQFIEVYALSVIKINNQESLKNSAWKLSQEIFILSVLLHIFFKLFAKVRHT